MLSRMLPGVCSVFFPLSYTTALGQHDLSVGATEEIQNCVFRIYEAHLDQKVGFGAWQCWYA